MGALLVCCGLILVVVRRAYLVKLLLKLATVLSRFKIEDLAYLGWPFSVPEGQITYFSTVESTVEPSWYRHVNESPYIKE